MGLNDLHVIGRMTLSEYFLRLEAYQIQKVDVQSNMAMQAWMNQTVQATTGSNKHPRPKYKQFNEFYNSTAMENQVHKSFNPDYVPPVLTKQEKEQSAEDLYIKRYKELQKIRERQKRNKKNK